MNRRSKVGGIAAVGGLAYAAWSRYRQNEQFARVATPPADEMTNSPSIERFIPGAARSGEADELGLRLLQAMVAAAQTDGRLDSSERHAIYEHVGSLDLSETERADLLAQLTRPIDMNALVAAAATPGVAAEIYTASLLAIDVDTAAERAYLAMLAPRLGLPGGLVESTHRELNGSDHRGASPGTAQRAVS